MMLSTWQAGIAVAALATLPGTPLLAQDRFPSRAITMIVPLAPGASVDIETRMYSLKLTELLRSQVVVDYKPGAGTTLGAAYVAKSAPDGYTLLSTSSSLAAAAALYPTLPFDPIKDLAPVSLMSKAPYMLLVHPAVPANSIQEFVGMAKAKPGSINFGTSGQGGLPHLMGEYLHSLSGTKVTFVHYKGGGPAYAAVMSGEVHAAWAGLAPMIPQIRAGKVKAIGMSTAERSKALPDVPAVAEAVPGYDMSSWIAVFAPGRTPSNVINQLSTELAKVAKSPDVAKRLESQGVTAVGSTPSELQKLFTSEVNALRKLGKETGISLGG